MRKYSSGTVLQHLSNWLTGWLAGWLADCPLGPAPGLPQCWGNSTHTRRHPCLLKPSPVQSRLAQHSLRASAVRQAVKGHAEGQIVILLSPPGRLTVAAGPAKTWGTASFLFVLKSTWSGQRSSYLTNTTSCSVEEEMIPLPPSHSHTQTAPTTSQIQRWS